MDGKFIIKKTCSIYASDLHFATMIFPFVCKELNNNTTIRTILEADIQPNILKIIENIGLNFTEKQKIKEIDWRQSSGKKIKSILELLEKDLKNEKNVDLVICGTNIFIDKVNKVIDLWVKNNIQKLEDSKCKTNIINCYSFEENKEIGELINSYDYILKTAGIEEIFREELKEAN